MFLKKILLALLLYVGLLSADSNLTIYSDYNKTIELAQKENKPVFILFTKENCKWCEKLKSEMLTQKEIEEKLQSDYLVLFLDQEKDNYPTKYEIRGVPSVFLVSEKEEVYTEIMGYHPKPKAYLKWFHYVDIERED
jgi:thioredoxin-related protein